MIDSRFNRVLYTLSNYLPVDEVNWVVTGSLGLTLQGMALDIHDVDIQTDKLGAYEIERRFSGYLVKKVEFRTSEKIRSHFGELSIEGVKIEILGDIQNPLPDGTWTYPADITMNRKFIDYHGMSLPVMSLEYECEAYIRLGRKERAEQIRKFLEQRRVKGVAV